MSDHELDNIIKKVGKESNRLDDLGMNSESYVIYENKSEIERKFKELIPLILNFEPKDVKKFGISRQTLWNIKKKIELKQISKVSRKVKITLMNLLIID